MEGLQMLKERKMWRRVAVWSGQIVLVMLAGQGILSYAGRGIPLRDFVILTAGLIVGGAIVQVVRTTGRSAAPTA